MRRHSATAWVLALAAVAVLSVGTAVLTGCNDADHEGHGHGDGMHTGGDGKQADTVAVVNQACPIMGSKIDPQAVPANLTRTYEGKKVGFCCAGCPAQWDELDAAEKEAKLAAVMDNSGS